MVNLRCIDPDQWTNKVLLHSCYVGANRVLIWMAAIDREGLINKLAKICAYPLARGPYVELTC